MLAFKISYKFSVRGYTFLLSTIIFSLYKVYREIGRRLFLIEVKKNL